MTKAAERDPRDIPTYGVAEAARYVRLPVSTLRSWVKGRPYETRRGSRRFEPVIRLPRSPLALLSFTNLVEAHVLAALRRGHRVPLSSVRQAVRYLERQLGTRHPLATSDLLTDGVDLFVERLGELVNVSREGQLGLRDILRTYLARVERDEEGLAQRLYLFTRGGATDDPRTVFVDPSIGFGHPVLAGPCVPTAVLRDRYLAGEAIADLARDFDCRRELVEGAIRFEYHQAA